MSTHHKYKEDLPDKKDDDAFEEGRTEVFKEPEESEEEI